MATGADSSAAARTARLLFCVSALGEIGVGVLVLLFPQILAFLMAASLDPAALLVARMLGSAALALGVMWWVSRREPVVQLLSRYLAGYLIYNLGMGVLFVFCAIAASEPVVPWIVAIGHLLLGVGFGAAVLAAGRVPGSEAAGQ